MRLANAVLVWVWLYCFSLSSSPDHSVCYCCTLHEKLSFIYDRRPTV